MAPSAVSPGFALALALALVLPIVGDLTVTMRGPYHLDAPAVGETADGEVVGVLADVFVTVSPATNGTVGGSVFLDTRPLLQLDMQGSARQAARVAAGLAGVDANAYDVFIAFRSTSSVVGGPSAGALMSVLVLAGISGHPPKEDVTLTGTVLPDGSVGPVGGVPEKATAAAEGGKRLFLFPAGQERSVTALGEEVDMETWCRDKLAITCRPVLSVEDAFAAVTGFAIERRPANGTAAPERSTQVLAPAASALLANATAVSQEAEGELSATTIPADLAPIVAQSRERLTAALAAAEAATARGEHYTASSKAFQAAVEARALLHYARWQQSGRDAAYVAQARAEASAAAEAAAAAAEGREPKTVAQLQALGAAQTRAREAQDLVEGSRNATIVTSALRDLAFAVERSATVHWWLSIGERFLDGPPVRAERLAEATDRALESATDSVAYAKTLVAQYAPGTDLDDLDRLLARARAEKERGFLASAFFTAVEADIRAGLVFAIGRGGVPAATLDRADEAAAAAIVSSRERGVEPILAASYVQFARSLRNESQPNAVEAYVFYQLARSVGRLPETLDLSGASGAGARFAPVADDAPRLTVPVSWMPAYLALGVATGAVAALVALARRRE